MNSSSLRRSRNVCEVADTAEWVGVGELRKDAPALGVRPTRRRRRARPVRSGAGRPDDKLPQVAEHPEAAPKDILAFTVFAKQIWSNRPTGRLNRGIRRRTDVGTCPHPRRDRPPREGVLAEQHDDVEVKSRVVV